MTTESTTESLTGSVERIVFCNRDNGWTVIRLLSDETGKEETAVGILSEATPGINITIHGKWVQNKKYGRQFQAETYLLHDPKTRIGIQRYLSSGVLPGVGKEIAKRIVDTFGLQTIEVLNADPRRLTAVEGIGKSTLTKIQTAWKENMVAHDTLIYLQSLGISGTYATRIHKKYDSDAMHIIQKDPYRLIQDIEGIGFQIADRIAQQIGIEADAPERLLAGILHTLQRSLLDGHVHLPKDKLLQQATKLLSLYEESTENISVEEADEENESVQFVNKSYLNKILNRATHEGDAITEDLGDYGTCIFLPLYWRVEKEAAESFAKLINTPRKIYRGNFKKDIAAFETKSGLTLAKEQRLAIEAIAEDKCVVITGGPGVGKTTITRGILDLLEKQKQDVVLAAPTGRAAKKLEDATGIEAKTIHRLLEFQPHLNLFMRNTDMPLKTDVVIVDEVSMLDINLFHALIVALPPESQLILIGDIDQLPSVGPGAVLKDIIASGATTVVRLHHIFRQAEQSKIIRNAHKINQGNLPDLKNEDLDKGADFFFIEQEDLLRTQNIIVKLVSDSIPNKFGLDPATDIQVMTPIHKGDVGTITLNKALQKKLNSSQQSSVSHKNITFCVGDKVMQTKNNYEDEVFNGNIGFIRGIERDGARIYVDFDEGRQVLYQKENLDQLTHAYAISVHKSQGAEYPAVVIPIVTQHFIMLQRNLLYTAITRGKKLVVLVGSQKAIRIAVKNNQQRKRYTWLQQRIEEYNEPSP